MRKKAVFLFSVFVLVLGILAACGNTEGGNAGGGNEGGTNEGGGESGETKELVLGTGSIGGVYYPLGGEIAKVWNDNIEGIDVSSVESGASVENIAKIGSGEWQLGIAQNTTAFTAVDGTGEFEGHPVKNFGVIASLYPEALQVVVLADSGIDSIADLKGKKVAIGPPGGATRRAAELTLKAYGIEEGEYQAFQEGFANAKNKLQNGTIDAAFTVVGIPSSTTEQLAQARDIKLLSLNEKAIQYFTENTQYVKYVMEPGTYEFQDEPVTTVTAMALLLASTDQIDEELGYKLTKTLFEHTEDMSIAQAKMITTDTAFKGVKQLPLHPGAKKYYEEIGILDQYKGQ